MSATLLTSICLQSGLFRFCGVPDSRLKSLCRIVTADERFENVTCANEGAAIAFAVGNFLGTRKPSVVYMQNSGLGNAINPILSIAHQDVYKIPMLLVVGWRGKPGDKDEPQHVAQGRITKKMLELCDIKTYTLSVSSEISWQSDIEKAIALVDGGDIAALLVEEGVMDQAGENEVTSPAEQNEISRYEAISCILREISQDSLVVATTGMISREVYMYREINVQEHANDFLCVGGMGHASSIATGLASTDRDKKFVCLDGDGAFLMHMGSAAVNADLNCTNLLHVVLNNGCHGSVGGQETVAMKTSLVQIAKACGYRDSYRVQTLGQLEYALKNNAGCDRSTFIEVVVGKGNIPGIGRPKESPRVNMETFLDHLKHN